MSGWIASMIETTARFSLYGFGAASAILPSTSRSVTHQFRTL
jgi:hypothetical protein